MRKAGGVLTIVGGIIGIGIGAFIIGRLLGAPIITFGIIALIVGIIALIGGIYALRARVWRFALAGGIIEIGFGAVIMGQLLGVGVFFLFGAIGALSILFGILGTIFIALRKGEFE